MKKPPREYAEVEYAGGPIAEKEEEPGQPPTPPIAPGKETRTHGISFNSGVRTVRIRCTEDGEWTLLVIDAAGSRVLPMSALRVEVAE